MRVGFGVFNGEGWASARKERKKEGGRVWVWIVVFLVFPLGGGWCKRFEKKEEEIFFLCVYLLLWAGGKEEGR